MLGAEEATKMERVFCKGCGELIYRPAQGRGSTREWCGSACRQRTIKEWRSIMLAEYLEAGDKASVRKALALIAPSAERARRRGELVAERISQQAAEAAEAADQ